MISEGIKTAESDRMVTQNFVQEHLKIGVETLTHIKSKNYSVKHLIF
jgi:AMP nucleosidase